MIDLRSIYAKLDWDLTSNRVAGMLVGKQNDTGRGMEVSLIQNRVYVTPTTEVLKLKYAKADQTYGYITATLENGKFYLENIDEMFTFVGRIICDFELQIGTEFITSEDFITLSIESVMNSDIISSDDYAALHEAIIFIDDIGAEETARVVAEAARVTTENTRVATESARVTAELGRAGAETTRVSFENIRISNEDTRVSSENTRIASENTRISQENTRKSQETARVGAESSRVTAETGRVNAEGARVTAEGLRVTNTAAAITSINTAVATTSIIWKTPVATYSSIATTYPTPALGWRVETLDTKAVYRYDGSVWVYVSDNSIPAGTEIQVNKGVANGYAPLDASAKVPVANLPVMNYAPPITGAATTIDTENLTVSRALVSDASGKVAVSTVTSAELAFLSGITSSVQAQLSGLAGAITGAASTIDTENLTISRALVSDTNGKVAVSAITSAKLGYLTDVTSNIQAQLDARLLKTGGAITGNLTVSGTLTRAAATDVYIWFSAYDTW